MHLIIDSWATFHLHRTKIRTKAENGQILVLSATKLEYDVILTSQLVISSWILLFIIDFTHF